MIQKKIPRLLCLPHQGAASMTLGYCRQKQKMRQNAFRVCLILFHSASTLSGSLCSPPAGKVAIRGRRFLYHSPLPLEEASAARRGCPP